MIEDCLQVYFATIIVHLCTCAIGYIGNVITCVVIASNKSMHTTTNVYLFNLAIADLVMLTAGLDFFTTRFWHMWKIESLYGSKWCYGVSWILRTAFQVSIMTITAFTIERYIAICHPFVARRILKIHRAIQLVFVFWMIGTIFGYLLTTDTDTQFYSAIIVCGWTSNSSPKTLAIESLIFFILPVILLVVLYILIWKKLSASSKIQKYHGTNTILGASSEPQRNDQNRRIFIMLITVVTVFFTFWAPFHIVRLYEFRWISWEPLDFGSSLGYLLSIGTNCDVFLDIQSIAFFISASINPIIYSVMSSKFRNALKELLIKCYHVCRCKHVTHANCESTELERV